MLASWHFQPPWKVLMVPRIVILRCLLNLVMSIHKLTLMKASISKGLIGKKEIKKNKLNRKLLRNLKKAEVEKESLCAQLLDFNVAVDFLKLENFTFK